MNQEIAEALARAKWNESVLVRVAERDSDREENPNPKPEDPISTPTPTPTNPSSRSLLLVPTLDRDQGGIRWENALAQAEELESDSDSDSKDALKVAMEHHIRTKIWMFPMLNDERRNRLYEAAIRQASREVLQTFACCDDSEIAGTTHSRQRLGTLDIGSGTGLLALLSSRHLMAARRDSIAKAKTDSSATKTRTTTTTTITTITTITTNHLPLDVTVTSLEMAEPMANIAMRTVTLERERARKGGPPSDAESGGAEKSASASASVTETVTAESDATTTATATTVDVTVLEGHSGHHPPLRVAASRVGNSNSNSNSESESTAPVVLCTSELLESGLLGEGWLPAMRDAWDRHLHPGAVVLPQSARVYGRLVSGVSGFSGPVVTFDLGSSGDGEGEGEGDGGSKVEDSSVLRLARTSESSSTMGTLSDGTYDPVTGTKQGIQVEIRADRYLAADNDNDNAGIPVVQPLSDPFEALDLDVTHPDLIPSPDPTTRTPTNLRVVATETGVAEGVLFWWELDLYKDPRRRRKSPGGTTKGNEQDKSTASDSDNIPTDLTYTTEPGSEFQDHWHQCLYVFPRGDDGDPSSSIAVEKGKEYTLRASHTDSRVHFSLRADDHDRDNKDSNDDNASDTDSSNKRPRPTIPPESNPVVTPRRCWQLNDAERLGKFRDGIRVALATLAKRNATTADSSKPSALLPATVLDVSDFSLCGMMASLMGATSVSSVESSSSGLPLAAATVAQIGNRLPRHKDQTFQILQCHAESLTSAIFDTPNEDDGSNITNNAESSPVVGAVVDLVVGEPYYELLEGWSIETALNYFYTIRMLKRKAIVKPDALCVPARAVVLACGIQCEDLGGSYRKHLSAGNSHVNGFDHQPIVDCWKYDRHGISIPLWEYKGVIPVTEVVRIGTLDYEKNSIRQSDGWVGVSSDAKEVDHNPAATTTEAIPAHFVKSSGWCHAIAFWVDFQIRIDSGSYNEKENDQASKRGPSSSFTAVSTGFSSPSQCAERQTVRILSTPQVVKIGESLLIPRHDLKL